MEVEWLPSELRLAPARCPGGAARAAPLVHPRSLERPMARPRLRARPGPRGRDPRSPYQPRSTLVPALHSFAEEWGRGREHREAAHHAFFVAGQDLGVRGFAWGGKGGGPRGRGGGDRVGPGPDLRPALCVRGDFGYRGARGTDHRHERGGALRRCSTEARPCQGRSTLCSPNGKTLAAWGGISFVRRHCFCYKPATNITSRVIGNHWGAP